MNLVDRRIVELRRSSIGNFLGAIVLILPLYVVAFLALFFVDYQRAWWLALVAVGVLLAIGLLSQWRSAHDEWASYEEALPTWNGQTYGINRAVNRVMGPAHLVNEFVMGAVTQLLRGIGKRKVATRLTRLSAERVESLAAQLRSMGTSPRFHPVARFAESEDMLVPLLAAEIIWYKDQGGSIAIGLNRKYDKPGAVG